jgi:1-acylglycerol-3-phosphate O-acyltransferase
LAAIFDPVFTASYPSTRLVEPISLFQAMLRAFFAPRQSPKTSADLVDLETLLAQHPSRAIVVFPECTPSNGRGILPLSPSLLTTPQRTKVYPVNLRYTSADITTPIPHAYFTFLWNLCSQPTHCIRIRVAEAVSLPAPATPAARVSTYNTNYLDTLDNAGSDADTLVGSEELEPITKEEKAFLDKIAESLARLGRIKRVGLGVTEKADFITAWTRTKRRK